MPVKPFILMIVHDWCLLDGLFSVAGECNLSLLWRNGGIKAGKAFGGCMQQHLATCELQQVVTSYLHHGAEQSVFVLEPFSALGCLSV